MTTQRMGSSSPTGDAFQRQETGIGTGRSAQASGQESSEAFGAIPNGPAAAAILAAGIGCFALGLFATLGDSFPAVAKFFKFYNPTGPLSGVTTSAIVVWLAAWYGLAKSWSAENVALVKVNIVSFILLALGLLLTFPPFMDFLQGK